MIKNINQNNVLITPFIATKGCEVSGRQTDDLLMIEPFSGSIPTVSIPIALEFVDYNNGLLEPSLNRNCNIALEQQSLDSVIYEEGISGSGVFYPDQEETNINGSYKRMVWSQIEKSFYNNYKDPTKLFGLENIDIGLDGSKRFFAEKIRVFTVPRSIFGEKILEGSVQLVDNALDDHYVINDDKRGNLIASSNLFSKYQVVRNFTNNFNSGSTGFDCPLPIIDIPLPPLSLTASVLSYSSASITWTDNSDNELGFKLWRFDYSGPLSGSWHLIQTLTPNVSYSLDITLQETSSYDYKVQAFNIIGPSEFSNTSSITTFDDEVLYWSNWYQQPWEDITGSNWESFTASYL